MAKHDTSHNAKVREAAKVAIMAVREIDIPVSTTRPSPEMPKTNGSVLKQPMFDYESPDKHPDI